MDDFIWQDAYSIGNETIDAEHRHLLELANQVARFRVSDEPLETVRSAVVALYDYVQTHFAHEEAYMKAAGYPGLPAHRMLHEAIVHEMNTIMHESPQLDTLVYNLKRLIKNWVTGHVQQADRQIGDFVRMHPPTTEPQASH